MKKIISTLLAMVLILNIVPVSPAFGSDNEKNRYIVKYKEETTITNDVLSVNDSVYSMKMGTLLPPESLNSLLENSEADSSLMGEEVADNTYVVELNDKELSDLLNKQNVELIEPDSTVILAEAEDAFNEEINWGLKAVLGEVSNLNTAAGKSVKVAVLDTGITSNDKITVAGGVSFINNSVSLNDDNGHGTQISAIIASSNNDGVVIGLAPETSLYAVKVLDSNGNGYYSDVIKGIDWAIDNGMNIISMSFSGNTNSELLHEAIKKAEAHGILVIASAGNNGYGDETETYPALFPEVLSVGAVNEQFYRAEFSSTGNELDLVAPGTNIMTIDRYGKIVHKSGTSLSSAYIAGAASAIWSNNLGYKASEVRNILTSTATPLGSADEYGAGIVNLRKALGISTETIYPEFPIQEVPIGDPDPHTGAYGDVSISSIKTGDGQKIMAGGTVTVSAQLSADKASISVGVFAPDGVTKVASSSFTNKRAGETVTFTWSSSQSSTIGTYKIKFYYNNTDPEDLFAIHVSPFVGAPTVTKGTVTATSAAISWTSVANASGYKISYYNKEEVVSSSKTSHTITGLNANTSYIISVQAYNSSNLYGEAGKVEAATLKNVVPNVPVITGVTNSGTSIKLDWSSVDTPISYDIYLDNVFKTNVRNVNAYTFNSLQLDRTYVLGVAARNEVGASNIASRSVFLNDSIDTATTITSSKSATIDSAVDVDYFKFIPTISGVYYFESTSTLDLDAELYNANYEIVGSGTDISESNMNFYFGVELVAKQTYYLKVSSVGSATGSYSVSVSPQTDDYNGNNNVITVGTISGEINYPEDTDTFKFTPTKSGIYSFSTGGTLDTEGVLYNSNFVELASNDDEVFESAQGFNIDYNLTVGQTYYLTVGSVSLERGSYSLTIVTGPKPLSTPLITRIEAQENNIFIEWKTSPVNQVSGYKIFRDGIEVGNTNYTSYYDTNLKENYTYSYYVQAYTNASYSSKSATSTVMTSFIIPVPKEPIITLSDSGWSKQDVTFTITKGEAVEYDRLYYKIGEGTNWTLYTGGNKIVSSEGSYNVYAKTLNVYDSASYAQALVRIDKTPPSVPFNIATNFASSTQATLTWSGSDNIGVSYYMIYQVESGVRKLLATTTNTTATVTISLSASAVVVEAHDFAENTSEATTVLPDREPPSNPQIFNVTWLNSNETSIEVYATDNVGVVKYEIEVSAFSGLNRSTYRQTSANKYVLRNTASKPAEGIKTYVYVTAIDAAGNRSNRVQYIINVGGNGKGSLS